MGTDAKLLKDVTTKLLNLRLDHTEFTCLKALALFKPGTKEYYYLYHSSQFMYNFNIVIKIHTILCS